MRKELRDRTKELSKIKQDLLIVRAKTVGEARERVDALLRTHNTNKSRETSATVGLDEKERSSRDGRTQIKQR